MKYEQIKERKPEEFQRLTGVKREVFELMLAAVRAQIRVFGRPCTLPLADQLLLLLMYWREYRSQLHIASTYGVSEATVCRTIGKMERALLASGQFRLPGKKSLREPGLELAAIVVDATESAIQRPKKNRNSTTVARKSATPTKRN